MSTPCASDRQKCSELASVSLPSSPLSVEASYIATLGYAGAQRECSRREEYEKDILGIDSPSQKKKYSHRMSKEASQALEGWLLETLVSSGSYHDAKHLVERARTHFDP